MGDKKKNPDAFFRDALANHRIRPEERVWEQLSDRLDKRNKRALPIWWKWAAGLALLLGLTWLFYHLAELPDSTRRMTADETSVQEIRPAEIPEEMDTAVNQPAEKSTKEPSAQPDRPKPADRESRNPIEKSSEERHKTLPATDRLISAVPEKPVREQLEAIHAPTRGAGDELLAKKMPPLPEDARTATTDTYTVRIVSRGYALQPEKEKLVDELETKIGGFISKVDEGFGELQDAKNTLFASLTSKKERKNTK
ncbi:hypothetical protein SAMN05192553_103670 [Cyclobacterium xiamenense]|uniref:Uncharacterized protein n=1 Tax=Cyclobacterium xiamenense TaxID=1297121 RepID=A0A1H6YL82_9BACT|nr:hypothetical protein [Cyclobacterium xiamenense]SEJ39697.1 hypothetical protein SAMN05192553_103670 [Cyclobacterium xiamenense]